MRETNANACDRLSVPPHDAPRDLPADPSAEGAPGRLQQVWIVAPGDLFGGAERQILTLCGGHGRHFELRLLPIFDGPLAERARALGLPVTPLTGANPTFLDSVRRLRRLLAQGAPEVLHLHGYRASITAAMASFPSGASRLRVIKTIHGAQETRDAALRDRLRMYAYQALERGSDAFLGSIRVYVSHDLQAHLSPRGDRRSVVIHNGAAPTDLTGVRRPAALAPDRWNLAIVGRLDRVKNVALAIRALATPALRDRALLHVLGEGPERVRLEALCHSLGVQERVIFHGFVAEPMPYVAGADMLLVPSLHEGIPYTVLEAMQVGTPVIAANVGGIPEMLRHGQSGWLIDPRDADSLAAAIVTLGESPELRQQLARAARERFEHGFSAEAMIASYVRLYRGSQEPSRSLTV